MPTMTPTGSNIGAHATGGVVAEPPPPPATNVHAFGVKTARDVRAQPLRDGRGSFVPGHFPELALGAP